MLNKKLTTSSFTVANTRRHMYGLPEEVKIGKYNASEYNLIDSNLSQLLRELKLEVQKEAVIKELFKHSDEELHREKANVLGSFLSRGLPELRLPCEVYYKSFTVSNKIFFNAKEGFQKKNCEILDICQIIGR